MRIGEVARQSGVSAPAIRYYEAQKLLTRAARSPAGYRDYSPRVLDELIFIRRAQRLGLTLEEVGEILGLGREGRKPCARVVAICTAHLAQIEKRLAELKTFQSHLEHARRLAQGPCGFTPDGFCRAIFSERSQGR